MQPHLLQVKVCLRQPGQPQSPPLRMLSDTEVVEHLWTGERAIARRLLVAALPELSAGPMLHALAAAQTDEDQSAALAIAEGENPDMVHLVALINQPVSSAQVSAFFVLGLPLWAACLAHRVSQHRSWAVRTELSPREPPVHRSKSCHA